MKLKGDPSTSRALNRRLILDILRREGPRSRADIAAVTGLSAAAVGFVVGDLVDEGVLTEGTAVAGATGRRPVPVEINYASGVAVGFKLMVGRAECVVTDLATNPLASCTIGLPDLSPEGVAETLASEVPRILAGSGRPDARLLGIGVSMPGVINHEQTVCIRSHRFEWNNVPLASLLAQRARTPVWLEDDTNAYAIAQQLFGLGRQHRNMAVLAVGVGISCAVVVGGKLYRGANGAAGKLGHTLHREDGRLCECGRHGCLMAYYSQPSLLRRWREAEGGELKRVADLTNAVRNGDQGALGLVAEAGSQIGAALANLVNVTDPEIIVMGGEAVAFGAPFIDPLKLALQKHSFWTAPELFPDWEDNSWARGAAALVTQRLFDFEIASGALQ